MLPKETWVTVLDASNVPREGKEAPFCFSWENRQRYPSREMEMADAAGGDADGEATVDTRLGSGLCGVGAGVVPRGDRCGDEE